MFSKPRTLIAANLNVGVTVVIDFKVHEFLTHGDNGPRSQMEGLHYGLQHAHMYFMLLNRARNVESVPSIFHGRKYGLKNYSTKKHEIKQQQICASHKNANLNDREK